MPPVPLDDWPPLALEGALAPDVPLAALPAVLPPEPDEPVWL
ncbi:hypothetical protein ACLF3G_08910 [Falsiroseomonas sp. HC035]